jgi:hypothetical protein
MSSNYVEGVVATYKSVEGLSSLSAQVSRSESESLQKAYGDVLNTYAALLRELKERQDQIISDKSRTYDRLRTATEGYFSSQIGISREFDSLVKRILLRFLETRDRNLLTENLRKLRELLISFAQSTGDFKLGGSSNHAVPTRRYPLSVPRPQRTKCFASSFL